LNISFNWKALIGKTKTRSQMCEVFTEDGRIVDLEIPVLKGCVAADDKCSAWLMDPENQVQDESTGIWYQVYGERSTIPMEVIKDLPDPTKDEYTKLIQKIFHESWVLDLIVIGRESARNKVMSWVALMLGSTVCLSALVIAIGFLGKK
jgi:hypothetical protein